MTKRSDSPEDDASLSIEDESPVVKRVIERAVAPFVGKVSPAYLAAMRAALADVLNTHPVSHTLIRSLEERSVRQRSGEEASEGTESPEQEASSAAEKRRAGGQR